MPLGNTSRSYGSITKTFHWLTMLLIFAVIPLGMIANGMAQDVRDPAIATTTQDLIRTVFLFSLHKTLGVTIFFVALARILWAFTQPKPGLLNADNRPEAMLAETIHWLLYGSLILVPLTGWIHHSATVGFAPIRWPFGQNLPFVPQSESIATLFSGLHMVLERVMVVSILLHVAGALKHHFIDRDATLRRMLPGTSDAPIPPTQHRSLLPFSAALVLWAGAIALGGAIGAYGVHTAQTEQATQTTAPQDATSDTKPDWQVSQGTLGLTIQQLGNPVQGSFVNWTADITFDDTATSDLLGTVQVTIDIASLSLGTVAAQAMGPDFFDVETFPSATFSGDITRSDTGYVATGPLTIRDQTIPVTLPFALTLDDDTAQMTGTLRIKRLDFNVGATLPDESSVGFAVDINVALTAARTP